MKIMLAEYAIGAGVEEFLLEGKAMLRTLARSFEACGNEVFYPTSGITIGSGNPVPTNRFDKAIAEISRDCDAGLVIAPDELLGDFSEIVEENTVNLGCPSGSVRICADKLECTQALVREDIPVPETIEEGRYNGDYVIKPRFGCASEGIRRSKSGILQKGYIATRFIKGEHLSVSLITGKTRLLLTVNKQLIDVKDCFTYKGGIVPYHFERNKEIIDVAKRTAKILGCRGYSGVDIVLGDKPYVVDVNPRPTTSIIGISRVLEGEIADLILKAKFGGLPDHVNIKGSFAFNKNDLSGF